MNSRRGGEKRAVHQRIAIKKNGKERNIYFVIKYTRIHGTQGPNAETRE